MNRKAAKQIACGQQPVFEGLNVKRGRDYFFVGLLVLPVIVGLSTLTGGSFSLPGAIAFVLIVSILAGVIGTFTGNVGF